MVKSLYEEQMLTYQSKLGLPEQTTRQRYLVRDSFHPDIWWSRVFVMELIDSNQPMLDAITPSNVTMFLELVGNQIGIIIE